MGSNMHDMRKRVYKEFKPPQKKEKKAQKADSTEIEIL